MGLDKSLSRKRLLEIKSGVKKQKEEYGWGKAMVNWGKEHESTALNCFAAHFRGSLGPLTFSESLQHVVHPHLCGTPDAVLITPSGRVPVEVKCRAYPDTFRACPWKSADEIPAKYVVQVQAYMELLGSEEGFLVCWTIQNGTAVWKTRRNTAFFETLLFPDLEEWSVGALPLRIPKAERRRITASVVEMHRGTDAFAVIP